MYKRQLVHRNLVMTLFSLLVVVLMLSACGAPSDGSTTGVGEPATDSEAAPEVQTVSDDSVARHEAPMLVEQVDSGQLPPLEERLPVNPKVVTPHEEIGRYGGNWRLGLLGGDDSALIYRTIGYEQLMRWNLDWTEVEPNIVESVDVSDDATEFIFHMREGMKWSDGVAFTADDILWWYENIFVDEEITLSPAAFLVVTVDGEKMRAVFEKVDDYTFTVRFAAPNGMFLS